MAGALEVEGGSMGVDGTESEGEEALGDGELDEAELDEADAASSRASSFCADATGGDGVAAVVGAGPWRRAFRRVELALRRFRLPTPVQANSGSKR